MFHEGRTLLGQLLVVIALLCLAACRQEALFQDRFHKSDFRMSYAEKLRVEGAAPIVVLGRVKRGSRSWSHRRWGHRGVCG